MSNQTDPIRQHHVPKVYLKNFCTSDGSVAVLDKSRNKIFYTGLNAIAVEKNFYTVDKLDNPYYWENAYANGIEPLMGSLIPKIISRANVLVKTGHCILHEDEKAQLALIMIMQLLRGKQSRKYEEKIFGKLLPTTIERAKEKFKPLTAHQMKFLDSLRTDPHIFKQISMEVTLDTNRITQFANILASYQFVFFHICGNMEFVTSDNPVMFINCNTTDTRPFTNGLLNKTTLIYYPLSPKLLLCAIHPNTSLPVISNMDRCIFQLDSNEEKGFISTINRKQGEQCHNQVFAFAKEILEKTATET